MDKNDLISAGLIKDKVEKYIAKNYSGKKFSYDVIASSNWVIDEEDGIDIFHVRFIRWKGIKGGWISEQISFPLSKMLEEINSETNGLEFIGEIAPTGKEIEIKQQALTHPSTPPTPR